MSTLPDLFRTKKYSQEPKKQGGIYSLNLTEGHSYRGTIVHPPAKQEAKNPSFRLSIKTGRYQPRQSVSLSYDGKGEKQASLEVVDNVKVNIYKVKNLIRSTQKEYHQYLSERQQVRVELREVGERQQKKIEQMQRQIKQSIGRIWQSLSKLRRETAMELKVCKKDIVTVNQMLIETCEIIKDIQAQKDKIKSEHF